MYTDPEVITTDDLSKRAYVKVYIDGKRHRFYNGKPFSINCNPNHSKTIKERNRALATLCFTIRKNLQSGWRPNNYAETTKEESTIVQYAGEQFQIVLDELAAQDLSKLYKRDIENVGDRFVQYLKDSGLHNSVIDKIDASVISNFLMQFNHSATYFMNKRRTLAGIFSRLVTKKIISVNPVHETSQMKERATLHQAYTKGQLNDVLTFLKTNHTNLHLCALLMYGCLLRPHQEIRQLYRRDLSEDCSSISLGGYSNKSGKVRSVHVPTYVQETLKIHGVQEYKPDTNIFTRTVDSYNDSYFNTAWSRVKDDMITEGLIGENHTLYSFRHTAAINLYMKSKDIFKVQQAMGHSSMSVTLVYMRSLGIINNISADDSPEL